MSDIKHFAYTIDDFPAKSITLYSSRALVTREKCNIPLQAGNNTVEIYGLTPTADEHSVKIDGRGAVSITDMSVALVPNREVFELAYPDFFSADSDDSADESDPESDDDDDEQTKKVSDELQRLQKERSEVDRAHSSAVYRLEVLEGYVNGVVIEHLAPDKLKDVLDLYQREEKALTGSKTELKEQLDELSKEITKQDRLLRLASKVERKRRELVRKEKAEAARVKQLKRDEKRKEKARVREEKVKFWARQVYKVTVSLDVQSDTPGSSRRNSIDSVTLLHGRSSKVDGDAKPSEAGGTEQTVDLYLSYVTDEAGWKPRYDLSISSLKRAATIIYRAEYINLTSETWTDAKISLSTSQTTFGGLEDNKVPRLEPWRIRIGGDMYASGAMKSNQELAVTNVQQAMNKSKKREDMFGVMQQRKGEAPGGQMELAVQMQNQRPEANALFGTAPMLGSGGAQRSMGVKKRGGPSMAPRFGGLTAAPPGAAIGSGEDCYGGSGGGSGGDDGFAAAASDEQSVAQAMLGFEEASFEDEGLTTVYEISGVRTLAPSSVPRRHRLATLAVGDVRLSHISVPKLRRAAFLRAKMRNPSAAITLLKGQAGVTLDGSFIGTTGLERVGPSQAFELPLGIDAGVQVSYPGPAMHRSTQGIFNKDSTLAYSRTLWLTNAKAVAVDLQLLDQLPLSEDEKVRVDIVAPKGLHAEHDAVRTGAAVAAPTSAAARNGGGAGAAGPGKAWGKATASLKADGKILWDVQLEKGQSCLLKLDYEVKLPASAVVGNA